MRTLGHRSSPTTNANYFSYWAGQPSVDYTSCRAKIKEILEHWIHLVVGRFHARLLRCLHRRGLWELRLLRLHSRCFVLKHAISNVMHSSSQGRVKSSLRSNQPSGDQWTLGIWDQSYAQIVANAIGSASKADIDSAFSAGGGVGTSAATCYHSSGENGPMSTPRRAHQDRRAAPTWRLPFSSKLLPFL